MSEIVGYEPATTETRVLGLKGDPLNLAADESVQYDDDGDLLGEDWSLVEGSTRGAGRGKKSDGLSKIGHGQVPVSDDEAAPAGISFAAVIQRATVSFASLRRIQTGQPEADAAGRALLVALGLAAHQGAFGRSFSLRKWGCEQARRGSCVCACSAYAPFRWG